MSPPIAAPSRLRFARRWAALHLLLSLALAALAALLVLGLWYPAPWRQMFGVADILLLLLGVLLVCGPLLTMLLASPYKSVRERRFDLSLLALLQLAALGYGLWAVFAARPVLLVFEVDRLLVVSANEVQTERLRLAPPDLQRLPWAGVRAVALRQAQSPQELLYSLEQSLQGVTQAMRPDWWRPFEEARPGIDARARPLAELLHKRPQQRILLEQAAGQTGLALADLRFLPLTSSQQSDWVALLDRSGNMVGQARVDGFD